jgi:uncharacterized protein YndB with AHSA1/START domain
MNSIDEAAPSQTESIAFEFELHHSPQKVWRALTDPVLSEWLLPVVGHKLEPGAAFTFKTPPFPGGWDGIVNCRIFEIEPHRKLSYTVGVPCLDTVVTFTLTPTAWTRACPSCSRASSRTRSGNSAARATAGR